MMQNNIPHLRSFGDWVRHVIYGLCIGASDLVPGFSGGTMALILGIYEEFIYAIKSFSSKEAFAIFKLRIPTFLSGVSWDFLLAIVLGIVCSLATLSQVVHHILGHEVYRIYLYSLFLGMIAASIVVLIKQLKEFKLWQAIPLLTGAIIAFMLTETSAGIVVQLKEPSWILPWFMMCGAIAISAMLLPGISGSYMLMILGVFPIVIGALADLVKGLKDFSLDLDAFLILANLGVGIFFGAILFSRVVSWLFQHYHSATLAALIGFMIGATKAVWPFWTYEYRLDPLKLEKGPQLHLVESYIPPFSDLLFWKAMGVVLMGFAIVLIVETMADKISLQKTGEKS